MINDNEIRRNCHIIIVGSLIYDFLLVAILSIFVIIYKLDPILYLGILIGSLWSILCILHIGYVLERSLDARDESYAKRFTIAQSVLRKVILVVIVYLVAKFLGPYTGIAVVVAVFGVKFGTYLHPILEKKIK